MLMNISTKFHACIRMCKIIVTSRSTKLILYKPVGKYQLTMASINA